MSSKPKSKICFICKQNLPIERFEEFRGGSTRRMCRSCRLDEIAKKTSDTPYNYLDLLYKQIKSSRVKQKISFDIEAEDVKALWDAQNGRCALSGVVMTYQRGRYSNAKIRDLNASLDRINSELGYTKTNIQLVAARINLMKSNLPEDMFLWWVRTIYGHKS